MLIGSQYTQVIQKLVVLLVPGLTSKSTVLSLPLLPTSATKNPSLPILPIPLPSDPPRPTACNPPPPPLPSISTPKRPRRCMAAFRSSHVRFPHACPTRAPGDAIRIHSVLNTHLFPDTRRWRGENETDIGVHFWFVSSHLSSLLSFTCTAAERSHNKSPVQYILTRPFPSYLADVSQKPEGWMETPQVSADAKGPHTVYAIDCEMVHSFIPCNSLN